MIRFEKPYKLAQMQNFEEYHTYLSYLYLLVNMLFEYDGLPDTIDRDFFEMALITHGYLIVYNDPSLGLIASLATKQGFNHYHLPTSYHTYSMNGTINAKELNGEDVVLVKNNAMMIPTMLFIEHYAKKLANYSRTIDINVDHQKMPYVVQGSKSNLAMWKQFIKQIKEGVFAIFTNRGTDLSGVSVLETNAPFIANDLNITFQAKMRECMTLLGVNNGNMDKAERVQAAEVNANNQQVIASRDIWFMERKKACEEINKKFGTHITVKLRSFEELKEFSNIMNNKEGEENEE